MSSFWAGVISSIVATGIIYVTKVFLWPAFRNKALYRGVRIDGSWEIVEQRNEKTVRVGKIVLKQTGGNVSGHSERVKTRDGKASNRQFVYSGSIHGRQLTLLFDDRRGVGFDAGAYVFVVQNDGNTMIGMATFHGKIENKIVSESRTLRKVLQ
ncbi:MAG: hypothetical protein E2593_09335 [Stenotrophomonas sp.]|nr:hypothetical protein [Stenotrophomonas sp.]